MIYLIEKKKEKLKVLLFFLTILTYCVFFFFLSFVLQDKQREKENIDWNNSIAIICFCFVSIVSIVL